MTICSLNVRGLSNDKKRRETFLWLKKKQISIYFLQETHSTNESGIYWRSEWGYSTIFTEFSSSKAGVGILFSNNFQFNILKCYTDPEGRFIIVDVETEEKILTLVNIYAPNRDDPIFFRGVSEKMLSFECDLIVFGGDFNLVCDVEKDKKGGNPTTHWKSREEVFLLKEQFQLADIWRINNPDVMRFTWERTNPEIRCRLDFFLISESLCPNVLEAEIHPGYRTDHRMITVKINNTTNPRGPGFWKLNTNFLTESEYVELIKKTIQDVSKEYKGHREVDKILLWDVIKMEIRAASIKYAKAKKSHLRQKEYILEKDISAIEKELDQQQLSEADKESLHVALKIKRQEMEEIIRYKTAGAVLRSKIRWYNEGERNTKYFHSLEKRHFNRKTIRNLKTENNARISKDAEILQEAKTYYEFLYSSKIDLSTSNIKEDSFFPDNNKVKLNYNQKISCEGLLSAEECLVSLKTMESGKSPGTDGLPAEFYKIFWNDVSTFLIDALNMSFSKGCLSISQRRGLITLLPKKNKPRQYLKNWRPITLLNCDYKIAAKTIATRLKKVLPHLINNDQTGFLKGRFIGENIRLINSVIDYAEKQNIPGLLLFVDFEKAFDTLEWTFVEKTLFFYNFGESIKSWIKLFYTNITSCIQNNGWSSDFFQLGRGVRQGCPLSPYLFILCVEILANAVRNNDGIKGICISETECKISQYADDTTLILDGTDISAKHSLGLLDSFAEISGLKVNYEKTEALWIGSLRLQNRRIELNKNILWSFCKVNALGVWVSTIKEESAMLNFQEKKEKISKIIENWQFRRLTLLGKITVIKSLLASQLVYILSPLPTPSGYLKEINSLLYKFLWNGKCDKIKRVHMINDYTKGGLKMLDIQSFNNAVKAKWVQRYLDPNNKGKWKLFTDFFLGNHHATALFLGNLKPEDVATLTIEDPFTKELVEAWCRLNFICNPISFSSMSLWYNSYIRINGNPFFYKSWFVAGVTTVSNLFDETSSRFLTFEAFKEKYTVKANFLQYHSVVTAVLNAKKNFVFNQTSNTEQLVGSKNFCKLAYNILIMQQASLPQRNQDKWISDFQAYAVEKIDWSKTYSLPFLCTRESKLRVFQFKLIHRRISTNRYLFKVGLSSSEQCSFCENTSESLLHLLWECPKTKVFWNEVIKWLGNFSCLLIKSFSPQLCLGFVDDTTALLLHHALLIARYHIFWAKSMHHLPSLELFIRNFLTCLEVERRFSQKTGS